jgi:addiction module RelE/StbE family toxin
MKLVYTDEALRDLEDILRFIAREFPEAYDRFEERLRRVERRISHWPESSPEVVQRPGIRVVTLTPYPYRLFYHITARAVEILHIRHTSRRPLW